MGKDCFSFLFFYRQLSNHCSFCGISPTNHRFAPFCSGQTTSIYFCLGFSLSLVVILSTAVIMWRYVVTKASRQPHFYIKVSKRCDNKKKKILKPPCRNIQHFSTLFCVFLIFRFWVLKKNGYVQARHFTISAFCFFLTTDPDEAQKIELK